MQYLQTLAELDTKLAECDRAQAVSDTALREVFGSFCMHPPADSPADPWSPEYARYQLELYRKLAGKTYQVSNEATHFDVDSAVGRPFPYCTGNTALTADQFTAIGALLRRLRVKPGARIVEFGPGWGNTTLALAQLGFHVTAIDIEPRFCDLVQRRAALHGLNVTTVNEDFTWIEHVTEPFDAAIFFECFHHATDHLGLLNALHKATGPDASLLFGGEPISPQFPMPWGLRMDGQSLWSIRKHGWFELGFQEDYFAEALARTGWSAAKYPSGDSPIADVWEAGKCRRERVEVAATDRRMIVPSEMRDEQGIRLRNLADAWGFFGPYVTLAPGQWLARAVLRPEMPCVGRGIFDVCAERGQKVLSTRKIDLAGLERPVNSLEITLCVDRPTANVEVRWHCLTPVELAIDRIELVPLGASLPVGASVDSPPGVLPKVGRDDMNIGSPGSFPNRVATSHATIVSRSSVVLAAVSRAVSYHRRNRSQRPVSGPSVGPLRGPERRIGQP